MFRSVQYEIMLTLFTFLLKNSIFAWGTDQQGVQKKKKKTKHRDKQELSEKKEKLSQ